MSVPDSSSAIIQWTHVVGNDTWTQVNDPCGNLGEWEAAPAATTGSAKAAWQHFDYYPHFYERPYSFQMVNGNKAEQFPWQSAPVGGYVGATVTRYSIICHYSVGSQGDYLDRLPKSWEFQGSTAQNWDAGPTGWVSLDQRAMVDWHAHAPAWHNTAQSVAFHFEFANTNPYRWYRFRWNQPGSGNNNGGIARIVQLMTWEHSPTAPPEGFTLSKTSVILNESGTTDTVTIVLDAPPSGSVTFNIVSADIGEVTVAPSPISFTNADWNTPQTITFTGVNDTIIDGTQTTSVTFSIIAVAGGDDAAWFNVPNQTVTVTTTDNDVAGFTLNKVVATVSESGTTDTIIVSLNAQPNSNVVLNAVSADTNEVTVLPAALVFTTANWNTPQTLTVQGKNDNIVDGNQTTLITISVINQVSSPQYHGVANKTVTVTTTENLNYNLDNSYMSMDTVSGGFPHLYRTDVSGAPIDASAVRSVARCDVAELRAEITPSVTEEQEHHLVNIAAKRALTVTEFKQMFYARGDGKFSLANVYECANLSSNILSSVWGKRVSYTHQGPGQPTTHVLVIAEPNGDGTGAAVAVIDESIVIYDAFGKGVRFVWKNNADLPGGSGTLLEPARFTDNGYQPAKIGVKREWAAVGGGILMATELSNAINRAAGYHGDAGAFPDLFSFPPADLEGVGTWAYKASNVRAGVLTHKILITSRVNSSNPVQRVDITDQEGGLTTRALGTAEEQQATAGVKQGTHAGNPNVTRYGHQHTPYNDSRVMNYNKLGGRPNDPSGVDLAYGYATDLQRNFYAQFEVMGNLERDLCVKRDCWTLCSRLNIEDQLYGLSFVAETCDDVCMKVTCSRKWSEVEDALAESCMAENSTIGWGDYVDLYINVRVTNANPKTLDTLLRIRYPVQITRGPDDLGNWNVVASDAAAAVLTTGVPYDVVEGGNLQYMNASQIAVMWGAGAVGGAGGGAVAGTGLMSQRATLPPPQQPMPPACSDGMDVAFIIDYTPSMSGEINAIKAGATSIMDTIQLLSAYDPHDAGALFEYRASLVLVSEKEAPGDMEPYASTVMYNALPANQKIIESGLTKGGDAGDTTPEQSWTTCMEPFVANNRIAWQAKVNVLNTAGFPMGSNSGSWAEPIGIGWDEVMNGRQGRPPLCGSFLPHHQKIIFIFTDATPGGQDAYCSITEGNTGIHGEDDLARWTTLRDQAVAQGIKICVVWIDSTNANWNADVKALYQDVCTTTGGIFSENLAGGFVADINTMLTSMCAS